MKSVVEIVLGEVCNSDNQEGRRPVLAQERYDGF